MNRHRLVSVLEFQNSIPCKGDVLGHSFPTIIDGIEVQILFPSIRYLGESNGFYDFQIESPDHLPFKNDDKWGRVFTYWPGWKSDLSLLGVAINRVVIVCEVLDALVESVAAKLNSSVNRWRSAFYESIWLNGQIMLGVEEPDYFEKDPNTIGMHFYVEPTFDLVPTKHGLKFKGAFGSLESCISLNKMNEIINDIDLAKDLKIEYEMFVRARVEQAKGNTRYATMEATTAVELCVTQKIQERCDELGIDGKELCETFYRSLGDRFKLLKSLNVPLATKAPHSEIVRPRNDLFHNRNLTPTPEECKEVLTAVRAYLDLYMPNKYE